MKLMKLFPDLQDSRCLAKRQVEVVTSNTRIHHIPYATNMPVLCLLPSSKNILKPWSLTNTRTLQSTYCTKGLWIISSPCFFCKACSQKPGGLCSNQIHPNKLPKELILVLVVGLDIWFWWMGWIWNGEISAAFCCVSRFFFKLANFLNLVFCNEIAEFQKLLE